MLARGVAFAVTEDDPAGPFAFTRDILEAADVTVGNLECALSDRGEPEPKSYTFRGPPLAAEGLALAGFDAVALANNHALDYGPDALADTWSHLETAGIAHAGSGVDADSAAAPAFIEVRGVRVAVLSFADVPSEAGYWMRGWEAAEDEPGIAWADVEAVKAATRAAAAEADVVIVMFHFGAEGSTQPIAAQRELARAAVDSGADLVIGSHPHVLQEVEVYGAGLIAYSLGNFVFDGFEGLANESAILRVSFGPAGITGWDLVPVDIGYDGLPRPRRR
jgi:poly-gamma-glutamate synthesis protein (capsule biosynthesis protein)